MKKILFLLAIALLTSCGGGGSPVPGSGGADPNVNSFSVITTQEIGPAGGTLTGPIGSNIEGLVIEIPADALDAPTQIQVGLYDKTKQPQNPNGSELAGKFFFFGPSGLKFKKPIKVTIPYSVESKQAALLKTAFESERDFSKTLDFLIYTDETKSWESIACDPDLVMMTCTGTMDHFSGGGVGAAHVRVSLTGINTCEDPNRAGDHLFIASPCNRVILDGAVAIVGDPTQISQYRFEKLVSGGNNVNQYEVVARADALQYILDIRIDNQDEVEGTYVMVAEDASGRVVGRSNPVLISVDIVPGCEDDNGVVGFLDDNLKRAVAEALGLNPGGDITVAQIRNVEDLQASRRNIGNLKGLECAINLQNLSLANNALVDITPLAHLTKLRTLDLSQNILIDIRPLRNLNNLIGLNLAYNSIVNIIALPQTAGYMNLFLNDNRINDLRRLGGLAFGDGAAISVEHNPLDLSEHSASREVIANLENAGHIVLWDQLAIDLAGEGGRQVFVVQPPQEVIFDALVQKNDADQRLKIDRVDFYIGPTREPARNLFGTAVDSVNGSHYVRPYNFAEDGAYGVSAVVTTNFGSFARVHVGRQVDVFVGEDECQGGDGFIVGRWCSVNEPNHSSPCGEFSTQFEAIRGNNGAIGGSIAVLVCENKDLQHRITCVEEKDNDVIVHFDACMGLGIGGNGSLSLTLHFTKENADTLIDGYMTKGGFRGYPVDFNIIMKRAFLPVN